MKRLIAILLAVTMLAAVLVLPAGAEGRFTDIQGHWAEQIINDWAEREVVRGYPDKTFRPDSFLTRAEYAQIICNLLKLTVKDDKGFADVKQSDWFYDEALCVKRVCIMLGDEKGNFNANDNITRQEAFLAYSRLIASGKDEQPDFSAFKDGADVAKWAAPELSEIIAKGIIRGDNGKIKPNACITRAEFLALLSQTADAEHAHFFTAKDGSCAICQKTEDALLKFALEVSSADTVVAMQVFNDYSALVTVPAAEVDASSVTVKAIMQNVASLGAEGRREHSVTVNTGMTGTPALGAWLSNAFSFNSGYVKATIDGNACVYHVVADVTEEASGMRATSTDIAATRAAWQALAANVSAKTQEESDSYISIAYGSYLQIGTDKLEFEIEDDLKLDNFSDLAALKQNIREHVILNTVEADGQWQIVAELKAGTALAVSNSVAVLDKDVTIKLKNLPADTLKNLLTDLKAATDTKAMVMLLINAVNDVIGAVNGTTSEAPVEVEISFAK